MFEVLSEEDRAEMKVQMDTFCKTGYENAVRVWAPKLGAPWCFAGLVHPETSQTAANALLEVLGSRGGTPRVTGDEQMGQDLWRSRQGQDLAMDQGLVLASDRVHRQSPRPCEDVVSHARGVRAAGEANVALGSPFRTQVGLFNAHRRDQLSAGEGSKAEEYGRACDRDAHASPLGQRVRLPPGSAHVHGQGLAGGGAEAEWGQPCEEEVRLRGYCQRPWRPHAHEECTWRALPAAA